MITRLEAGGAREIMAPLDLAATARGVGELYEALAEDQDFTLEVRASEEVSIEANRELIGQALANLVDNALKYGRPPDGGTGRISIEVRRDDGFARLVVADQGAGIPVEERGRVLDRFVRLEESRSRPGFGLGLSLVNAVIHLHRGSLVLGDDGPGLRVEMTFPALPIEPVTPV
jgi:signal transduction histidine kinase